MVRPARVAALLLLLAGPACTESPSASARAPTASEPARRADPAAPAPPPQAGSSARPSASAPVGEPPSPAGSDDESGSARGPVVRFQAAGKFAQVVVVDEGTERHLRFGSVDSVDQSTISLASPEAVPMEYIRVSFLSVLYAAERRRALMVGLGGGTFTTLLRKHFPELWIDVAEIDPVVRRAAIDYFGVREDERYRIHIADGAAFVRETPHRYDIALIDAYEGDDIPAQLQTAAFFRSLSTKIAPDGVAVLNLSVSDETERDLEARFREAFAEVRCARTRWGGLVLFGRPTPGLASAAELLRRAREQAPSLHTSFDLVATAEKVRERCDRQPL